MGIEFLYVYCELYLILYILKMYILILGKNTLKLIKRKKMIKKYLNFIRIKNQISCVYDS